MFLATSHPFHFALPLRVSACFPQLKMPCGTRRNTRHQADWKAVTCSVVAGVFLPSPLPCWIWQSRCCAFLQRNTSSNWKERRKRPPTGKAPAPFVHSCHCVVSLPKFNLLPPPATGRARCDSSLSPASALFFCPKVDFPRLILPSTRPCYSTSDSSNAIRASSQAHQQASNQNPCQSPSYPPQVRSFVIRRRRCVRRVFPVFHGTGTLHAIIPRRPSLPSLPWTHSLTVALPDRHGAVAVQRERQTHVHARIRTILNRPTDTFHCLSVFTSSALRSLPTLVPQPVPFARLHLPPPTGRRCLFPVLAHPPNTQEPRPRRK